MTTFFLKRGDRDADAVGHEAWSVWTGSYWMDNFQVPVEIAGPDAVSERPADCRWCTSRRDRACQVHVEMAEIEGARQ